MSRQNTPSLRRCAIALATLAACATGGLAVAQSSVPATAPMSSGKLAHSDHEFVENALQAGLFEVEESQLALQRSQNTQIKGFAQQMIDDHTKAAQELSSLAESKGEKAVDKPSMGERAKIDMLKMHKEAFDKNYAESQVNAHQDAVKLFRKEATEGKDADLKAFAAKTLPTLEHHLTMAQGLKDATKTASR
jgi:putative membrane protein